MNKFIISNFLSSYKFIETQEEIDKFYIEKNIGSVKKISLEKTRTICEMNRYLNNFTNYKYKNKITVVIDFAQNATVELRTAKELYLKYEKWIAEDNKKNWSRSGFNQEKKEIGMNILKNFEYKPFTILNNLMTEIEKENFNNKEVIINLIYEITYYLYRLNERLYFYENSS